MHGMQQWAVMDMWLRHLLLHGWTHDPYQKKHVLNAMAMAPSLKQVRHVPLQHVQLFT
jgi:hypothetical protein